MQSRSCALALVFLLQASIAHGKNQVVLVALENTSGETRDHLLALERALTREQIRVMPFAEVDAHVADVTPRRCTRACVDKVALRLEQDRVFACAFSYGGDWIALRVDEHPAGGKERTVWGVTARSSDWERAARELASAWAGRAARVRNETPKTALTLDGTEFLSPVEVPRGIHVVGLGALGFGLDARAGQESLLTATPQNQSRTDRPWGNTTALTSSRAWWRNPWIWTAVGVAATGAGAAIIANQRRAAGESETIVVVELYAQ